MQYSDGTTTYTDADVRQKWQQTCYPYPLPDSALAELGLAKVLPEPPKPVMPSIPQVITAAQMRLQLLADGVLDDVEAAVPLMSREAQILWEYAQDIERSNSLLIDNAAALLGWDAERVDAFFVAAAV